MARNWEAGDLIMGRYRLISLLGQGGMGSVWRAEHVELKNQVAIKLLDPAIAGNEEMIGRFLREARAAASLQNRHVIQIFDHGVEDGEAFMVMELLEGESLGERLQKGPLPVEDTIKFMCQVMRAMGKAHDAGIIHRDLKPDNIFITYDDEGEYAKVLDFGVAKVAGDLGITNGVKTQTGMMLGTPFYMSPEQAKAKKVDARTDVWALAVITYECLTGKRPFTGESFADLVLTLCNAPIPIPSQIASVPVGFDEWFVHATQRDVDRRFRSARDMANELIQLANAPLTGNMGAAASAYLAKRSGPTRTPSPNRGSRMSMTTGGAAVGTRTPRPGSHLRSQTDGGNGMWIFAAAAMILVTGGVGFYAWKTSDTAQTDATTAAPKVQPVSADGVARHEDGNDSPAEGKPEPTDEKEKRRTDTPGEEAKAKGADDELTEKSPPSPSKPAVEPSSAATSKTKAVVVTTTPKKDEPAKPAGSGSAVPVVDNEALPPTEWEF